MAPLRPNARMAPWLEQAWLQRYFERQLDEEEQQWFEAYMLDKPELLDALSADLDLRDALHMAKAGSGVSENEVAASKPDPQPLLPPTAMEHTTSTNAAKRRLPWPFLAVAASVLVAFGAGFLLRAPVQTEDAIVVNPTRVLLDTSRGSGAESNVENSTSVSDFVLVDALVPVGATYVSVRGPGVPERQLLVSRDGVATLLLRRRDIDRIGPLTLRIKVGGHEFEKPLPLSSLKPGDNP